MNVLVLVVDDEPDIEALFRQQFRRDLRAARPCEAQVLQGRVQRHPPEHRDHQERR
jgi:hypothetical protein